MNGEILSTQTGSLSSFEKLLYTHWCFNVQPLMFSLYSTASEGYGHFPRSQTCSFHMTCYPPEDTMATHVFCSPSPGGSAEVSDVTSLWVAAPQGGVGLFFGSFWLHPTVQIYIWAKWRIWNWPFGVNDFLRYFYWASAVCNPYSDQKMAVFILL